MQPNATIDAGQQFVMLVEIEKLKDEARKVRRAAVSGGPRSLRQRSAAFRSQLATLERIVDAASRR